MPFNLGVWGNPKVDQNKSIHVEDPWETVLLKNAAVEKEFRLTFQALQCQGH